MREASRQSATTKSIRHVAVAILTGAILTAGCSKQESPKQGSESGTGAAPAVGSAAGRFVGSAACRSCHTAEYAAWSESAHHTTLRAVGGTEVSRLAGASLAAPYRVDRDGTVTANGADGKPVTARAALLLGGRHREDLIARLSDGRLQIFPVAFDVDAKAAFEPLRELAGGTPPPPDVVEFWTRAGRNFDVACYGCHATGQTLQALAQSSSGVVLPSSKWAEPGVGCEGCHGPGGPHVDAANRGSPDRAALKMARGGGLATIDACASCHGLREVLPSPFEAAPAHRYGEAVFVASDPLQAVGSNSEFRNPFFGDLRPSTYQQEAIAFGQSGCARKGGMTCSACHDVHAGKLVAAFREPDGGSSVCARCHSELTAGAEKHTHHPGSGPGSRCIDCHMAPVLRGPGHQPAHDHSMAPPIASHGQVPAACVACHNRSTDASRVAAAWKSRVPSAASKRREGLLAATGAAPQGTIDGRALSRLSGESTESWFLRWFALQTLASGASGPLTADAIEPLRGALSDGNPAIRRAAARALGTCGLSKDVEILQRASDDTDPWTALEAAHAMGRLGAPTAGARLLQLLTRPDLIADARAQYVYGHACLAGGDNRHAELALRRALELNPMMVAAINDLGLALIGNGKKEDAIAAWNHALDINPRYSAARANLDAAKTRH